MHKIKNRERTAVISSLKSGVVPRVGLQHIQVGRAREVEEIIKDMDLIKDDAATIRFIIGEYGSGKSFFLILANIIAHEKQFVATHADITTERTLYSRDGKARNLYTELIRNLTTKSKPEGKALKGIIEQWISRTIGVQSNVPREEIHRKLAFLRELVSGYDFAEVICKYYEGYLAGQDVLCENCLRWLRGEYPTKTDAKNDLGVRTIIDDSNYYNYFKLLAAFFKDSGFSGLMICIDELAVLTRLQSNVRAKNFETILRILNDCFQGSATGFGFLLGGTPEFLRDQRRGLYSYGALESRLAENPFANQQTQDFTGPVIPLENLSKEELFVVFCNIRNVFASYDSTQFLIEDEGIKGFMVWCFDRMGAEAFLSPREAIKNFVSLLSQLENYPNKSWKEFLVQLEHTSSHETDGKQLKNFKL